MISYENQIGLHFQASSLSTYSMVLWLFCRFQKINKIADKLNNEGAVKHDSCLRVLESGVKEV